MVQNLIFTLCNIATTFWGYMRGLYSYLIQPFSAFGDAFVFNFQLFDGTLQIVTIPKIPIISGIVDLISGVLGLVGIEFTILSVLIIASLTTFVTKKLVKLALND